MDMLAYFALNWFYYQSWLVVMTGAWMHLADARKDERSATAAYIFLGYLAVAWHPLIDELFKWLKQ